MSKLNLFTIKDICFYFNIGQTELSRRFDIPLRTIQNWHSGKRKPPLYVVTMICTILEYEKKDIIHNESHESLLQ